MYALLYITLDTCTGREGADPLRRPPLERQLVGLQPQPIICVCRVRPKRFRVPLFQIIRG